MFAVIKTGGKQYRVQEGDVLQVEKLDKEEGQKVIFNQVLLIEVGERTLIGTPLVEKAQVQAEIIESFKDKKVVIFKKKRRKRYKKKIGHRQQLSRVKIEKIIPGKKAAPKKKPTAVRKEKKAKEAPKKQRPKSRVKIKEPGPKKPKKKEAKKEAEKEARAKKESKVKKTGKKKASTKTSAKVKASSIKKEKENGS